MVRECEVPIRAFGVGVRGVAGVQRCCAWVPAVGGSMRGAAGLGENSMGLKAGSSGVGVAGAGVEPDGKVGRGDPAGWCTARVCTALVCTAPVSEVREAASFSGWGWPEAAASFAISLSGSAGSWGSRRQRR